MQEPQISQNDFVGQDDVDVIDLATRQTKTKKSFNYRYLQDLTQQYGQQVKITGLCDYPSLVAVMKAAYEVEKDPSLLLPSQVRTLLLELAQYQQIHSEIVNILRMEMNEVGEVFDRQEKSINPENLWTSMNRIYDVLEKFDEITIKLQSLTKKFQTRSKKWWWCLLPLDSESQQLLYLCQNLQYCHHYLVSHLSLGNLVKAKQENLNWLTFAKRLYAYIDESISVTGQLTSLLSQRIQERQVSR